MKNALARGDGSGRLAKGVDRHRSGGRSSLRLAAMLVALAMIALGCSSEEGPSGADDAATEAPQDAEESTDGEDPSDEEESSGEEGTTLVYSYPQEPPNWNYLETGLSAVTAPLLINVWETLVALEADGSTPIPLLAESWETSDDGLAVTFKLREGIRFHDGSDVTAADVLYSLNKNAESDVSFASAGLAPVTDVQALDDYTVEITLEQPSQQFLAQMASRSGIIVPENFFEDNDAATTVIGTGPYTFGEYRIDQDLTLHRSEDYWGELPYFETVVQRFIPDETAALNALLGGDIDMAASVIGEGMDRVESIATDRSDIEVFLVPGTEVSYWALNPDVEKFEDIRVRQAIQHGHNRQAHIDASTAGTATPSCSMAVPAGAPWDSDYCPYPYDPGRARELLEEAGATDLVVDLPFANVAWHTVMAQVFQAEMAEIGVTVELRSQDLATWLDQTNTQGDYEVFQITSGATIDQYRCGGGRMPFGDDVGFCDEAMDQMIGGIDSIIDRDDYIAAQRELHDYVADQGWLWATKKPNVPMLFRSDLTGYKEHRFPEPHVDVTGMRFEG